MDSTSLVFTGDIGFDKYMDGKWKDEELLAPQILSFLASGNHVIANVEGPLVQRNFTEAGGAGQLLHSMDPEVVSVLRKMHADIWNLNNNHIMDAGQEGLASTLKIAKDNGVKALGVGKNLEEASKPLILNEAGGIGILSVGYERACRIASEEAGGCLNFSRMDIVEKRIKEIKKQCRWCVIVAHDGEEFTALPTEYTRNRYLSYLDMGADVVVAHHPHVPMNYELAGEKAVFYSLGNFIFDTPYQRSQFNTEKGILLKLKFTEDNFSFEALGIRIDRESERVLKDGLPDIFENVDEKEYKLLAPLAAVVFIENTKRQLKYMKKEEFENATEAEWQAEFLKPMRSGCVPGKLLDFKTVLAIAAREKEKAWQQSRLSNVKEYMLKQL